MRMSKEFFKWISEEPKYLFLVDGVGAVISALLYFILLGNLVNVFGIPRNISYNLGFLAVVYAITSLTCFATQPKHWRIFLKIIAFANLLHCFITIALIYFLNGQITTLGILYIAIEVLIVVPLAIFELKTAAFKT